MAQPKKQKKVDPDEMSAEERAQAAKVVADTEAKTAPADNPLESPPWERDESIPPPRDADSHPFVSPELPPDPEPEDPPPPPAPPSAAELIDYSGPEDDDE